MSSIVKTRTQGFRVSTFRNQEVHKYYNHLQSVMRSIDSSGTYIDLFAKPEVEAMAVGETEIEWTCSSNGKATHISQVSESERKRIEKIVSDVFSNIEAYIEENKVKSGKSRDYAQFLSIVAKRPDSNQIWVINGKPVIVQWGFVDENGLMGSTGIYSDWDSFIKDIKKVEQKPKEEPIVIHEEPIKQEKTDEISSVAPAVASTLFSENEKVPEKISEPKKEEAKPVEKKEEPKSNPKKEDTEQKKTVYAGLGGYEWVKWVAILLAIIILLLFLLRLLFPPKFPNDLFGQNGASIGAINGGGMGGSGGGDGNGSQGSSNGQEGANGAGNNPKLNSKEPCPVCSKPFKEHSPEDYEKCIIKASGKGDTDGGGNGNSGGQGSPSGASGNKGPDNAGSSGSPSNSDKNGITGGTGQQGMTGENGASSKVGAPCNSCSGNGIDSQTGKPCSSCNGTGKTGNSGSSSDSDQNGITSDAGQQSKVGIPRGTTNSNGSNNQDNSNGATSNNGSDNAGSSDDQSSYGQQGINNGHKADNSEVIESEKQHDNEDLFNPEDVCPVCNRQFKVHSQDDMKNCILASQKYKLELQKKFEKLKSATNNYNKAVTEFNSDNSAKKAGDQ